MKKKNNKMILGAVVLCIAMITASASVTMATGENENFDKKVKFVIMEATPTTESAEITGTVEPIRNIGILNTDIQVTSAEEDELNPAIGVNPDEEYLMAYTFEQDITENIVPWTFSIDGGQTWDPGIYYEVLGIESHPAISYRGTEKLFAGTMACDPDEVSGAIQYTFMCSDPTDSGTYELTFIEWGASYPYYDRLIPDAAGYTYPEKDWWYGMIAVVGERDSPGAPDMPIFNYADYEAAGSGWSSYFSDYSGCENAAIDFDTTNGRYYAVFDYLDGTDWDLLLMRGDAQDDGSGHPTWLGDSIIGDVENTKYPAVGANEDYVMIVAQTDEAGNEDIVCYYSDDAGETFQMSFVADSGADELYPSIVVYGEQAACTFIMDGDLYYSETDDGGATWSTPEQINDEDGTVESDFRNVDITTDGNVIWTDNRNGNLDIYFDYIGGEPAHPILEIGEITGGIGKVSAVIKNVGEADATDVDWNISVTGGLIGRINIDTGDTIASLPVGEEETVTTEGFIFGLGRLDIDVVASCAEAVPTSVEKTATGKVLIFFVLGIE